MFNSIKKKKTNKYPQKERRTLYLYENENRFFINKRKEKEKIIRLNDFHSHKGKEDRCGRDKESSLKYSKRSDRLIMR